MLVTGTIAAGDSMVVEIAFRDQTAAYLAALREAWRRAASRSSDAATDSDGATRVARRR